VPEARNEVRGHRGRRAARRRSIDILYQADVTGEAPTDVVEAWRQAGRTVGTYAEEIVAGVEARAGEIDTLLGQNAEAWTVARMAVVDRTILRIAALEILTGVPVAVAINEAVEAARELSTEASGSFINGVLGKLARVVAGTDEPAT
jgi:N utilization substance protein B